MTMPAETPDPLDNLEPTDAEVAAAAEQETRDAEAATRALKAAAAPKRGPGRPPGSKTKKPADTAARSAAKKSTVTPTRPSKLTGAAANSAKEAAARKRAEQKATVEEWTKLALEFRPQIVTGVGMMTGIPGDFLIGLQGDEHGRPIDIEGLPLKLDERGQPLPGQNPALALTHYGEALAPKPWQVRTVVEAGVRLMDSEQGEKLLELWERVAPYTYGAAALGAIGIYTVSVMQASSSIREMVKLEMQQRAQAAADAAAAAGETPDGSSAGPTG